jgi:hypothetical protein
LVLLKTPAAVPAYMTVGVAGSIARATAFSASPLSPVFVAAQCIP